MVYDFGVSDATLSRLLGLAARHHGLLEVHCEDRDALESRTAELLDAGKIEPRFHADSRPDFVEAAGTDKAIRLARAADAPLYVVHLSCAEALDVVRAARAADQQVFAETCPHYLALDASRYDLPPEEACKFVISPPLRPVANCAALWGGLADGSLALVATDHVPDRVAVEKQTWHESFDKISNGGPGIETLLTIVYSEGVAKGRISVERMVDLLSTTPARLFGLNTKGSVEVGKDADLVIFDPAERRTISAAELHHTSDYTPYEGMAVTGGVVSTLVRGEFVVRDGHFVGRRGYGQFQERRLAWRQGELVEQRVRRERQELHEIVGQRDLFEQASRLWVFVGATASVPHARGRVPNRPCLIHCQTCEREISAVAASSIRLSRAAAPVPASHDAM